MEVNFVVFIIQERNLLNIIATTSPAYQKFLTLNVTFPAIQSMFRVEKKNETQNQSYFSFSNLFSNERESQFIVIREPSYDPNQFMSFLTLLHSISSPIEKWSFIRIYKG